MIKINSLSFKYKNSEDVLKDINLEVNDGDFITVVGKNGSRQINFS